MAAPWEGHRRRAELLRGRYPFAAEVLTLYLAVLDVWDDAWQQALDDRPAPDRLAAWAADRVLPGVVKATSAGPAVLAEAAGTLLEEGRLDAALAGWLAGAELPPVERYLARAALRAPLEALGPDAGRACAADPSPRDERHCPTCGGLPQLGIRAQDDDPLVSGGRRLLCARCARTWNFSATTCPSCGETTGSRRTVYAEQRAGPVVGRGATTGEVTFPHLRIDGCASCRRYVVDVDLSRDPRAVPEVDELAALPLDLYATEHGLAKVTTNLMGF